MLLEIESLEVAYGEAVALRDVSLSVPAGTITAVLGANGSGKTTLLRTISGLQRPRRGAIRFDGRSLTVMAAHAIVAHGVSHLPEGRGILSELTVLENLRLGAYTRPRRELAADLAQMDALFPILASRRHEQAGMLSGGEQQMVAIARSLLARPKLLMIDELSLGLAPIVTQTLMRLLQRIRDQGTTILLVEQSVRQALDICDRVYLLANGAVAFEGTPAALAASGDLMSTYLGLDAAEA